MKILPQPLIYSFDSLQFFWFLRRCTADSLHKHSPPLNSRSLAQGLRMPSCSKSLIFHRTRAIACSFGAPMSRHATALCSTIPNQYVPSLVSDMPFPCVWAMRRGCKKVQIRSHKTLPTAAKAGSTSDDEPLHSPDPEGAGKKGTMLGAVSWIVGTSIGSGILALLEKTSPAVYASLSLSLKGLESICFFSSVMS